MIHHSLMRSPHRFCMETFKRHISDFSENDLPAKTGKNGKPLFSYNFCSSDNDGGDDVDDDIPGEVSQDCLIFENDLNSKFSRVLDNSTCRYRI